MVVSSWKQVQSSARKKARMSNTKNIFSTIQSCKTENREKPNSVETKSLICIEQLTAPLALGTTFFEGFCLFLFYFGAK